MSLGDLHLGAVLATGLLAGGVSCCCGTGRATHRPGHPPTRRHGRGPPAVGAGVGARPRAGRPQTRYGPHRRGSKAADVEASRTGAPLKAAAPGVATTTHTATKDLRRRQGRDEGRQPAHTPASDETRHPPGPHRRPPRTLGQRLADDLAPIGGFLAGKLVAYTLLGALLGAAGTVVRLSVDVRAASQILAGALVICFRPCAVESPRVSPVSIEAPASWARFVRGRARSQSMFAPTLLGLCTVLIPCG